MIRFSVFVFFVCCSSFGVRGNYRNSIPNVQLPLENGYGGSNEQPLNDACNPVVRVVTSTKLVPTTHRMTRTRAVLNTVFNQITQTTFVPTTIFRQQLVTALANPVIQTTTDVVTQTSYLVRNEFITDTAYVTTTQVQFATKTQIRLKTQYITQTATQYQTQLNTQYQTVYKTKTQLAYSTVVRTVPQYITTTAVSRYPVYSTVVNTHSRIHYMTVTTTVQAAPLPPVQITHVQTSYYTRTVQAPCQPVRKGYY